MDTSLLLWGLVFGSAGFGFFLYGRKQKRAVPFVCGLALMVFPYFVSNTVAVVVIGLCLMAVPFFIKV